MIGEQILKFSLVQNYLFKVVLSKEVVWPQFSTEDKWKFDFYQEIKVVKHYFLIIRLILFL